jgi:hypothetical protein
MKRIFLSMLMLAGIAATAQQQAKTKDTLVVTEKPAKPDVRFLGKASTTTTITTTTTGRRKKKRGANANGEAVQQYVAPKDTVAVNGDTIKVYKADTIKTQ